MNVDIAFKSIGGILMASDLDHSFRAIGHLMLNQGLTLNKQFGAHLRKVEIAAFSYSLLQLSCLLLRCCNTVWYAALQ